MLFRLNGDYPFAPAHTKIMDYLRTLYVPALDLTPAFLGRRKISLWVKPYDSHPNAEANGIAARAVAPFIEQFIPATLRKVALRPSELALSEVALCLALHSAQRLVLDSPWREISPEAQPSGFSLEACR